MVRNENRGIVSGDIVDFPDPEDFHLIPPDAGLFFRRNEKQDRRLGEVTGRRCAPAGRARFVLVGCPQDAGVIRNRGRAGARRAPDAIRSRLYRFPAPENLRPGDLHDAGNVAAGNSLEETHARLETIVFRLLSAGSRVIVLGGGNDISYPDVRALTRVSPDPLVFNIDSHLDVRNAPVRHSGTPYRQLLEEKRISASRFFEMAAEPAANSPDHARYLREKGVAVYTRSRLRDTGVRRCFETVMHRTPADSIFWGFDMDAVRSTDAPGVSAPLPTGLTAAETCKIAAAAGRDVRSRVLEISEVNPEYDIDGRTARLAAMVIVEFMRAALAPDR